MLLASFAAVSIDEALSAGPALLAAARARQLPCFAVHVIEGPAVVLGQHQLVASVLDLAACARAGLPVFRRASAGTAAFIGRRALFCTLALPRVGALFPDASARTLLNRNVRPFLKGFSAAGVLAHYFGREWISFRKRPGALLGFDMSADGAVLVEVVAGFDHAIALPPELCSARERSLDRFTGHTPAALAELLPAGASPESVARCLTDAITARASSPVSVDPNLLAARTSSPASVEPDLLAARASSPVSVESDLLAASRLPSFALDITAVDPLLPAGALLAAPARVPIGWLEIAFLPAGSHAPPPADRAPLWLGGDVLAPRFLLDRIAAAPRPPAGTPLLASAPERLSRPLPGAPVEGAALPEIAETPISATAPEWLSRPLPEAPLEGASLPEIVAALSRALDP